MTNEIRVILPGIIVVLTAVVVLFADAWSPRRKGPLAWIASLGMGLAAAVAVSQWYLVWKGGWSVWRVFTGGVGRMHDTERFVFVGAVQFDRYGLFFTVLFCGAGIVTVLLSNTYLRRHEVKLGEFYALLLLIIAGMIGMAVSRDLITLLVSFELMSLPTYVLAGSLLRDRKSGEASIKYFVNGAFSSAVLAFGFALVYAFTGATRYAAIAEALKMTDATSGMMVVATVMIVVGFGFKIAAVPFHGWAPDVYEGAPTPFTAFMSVGIKAAAFAGFVPVFAIALRASADVWTNALIILAVLTMVVGNVLALPQRNLKRMLAYSSIAHAGYLLLGVIAAGKSGSDAGYSAVLFYLAAYAFMNLGAFGILVLVRNRRPFDYSLDQIAGLSRSMPLASVAMTLFMFSLTGIPPLIGFWGKFYIFTAVVDAGLTWLAIVAVLMSAVSAFYYLRVVWYLYFREVEGEAPALEPTTIGVGAALTFAVFGVVAVGLYPSPLFEAAAAVFRSLMVVIGA
jgi:NADH-quinone oxidoreductase subunit N